jgi:hypothetical protein
METDHKINNVVIINHEQFWYFPNIMAMHNSIVSCGSACAIIFYSTVEYQEELPSYS